MLKTHTLLLFALFPLFLSAQMGNTPCIRVFCLPATATFCDETPNDPELWNAPYWTDPTVKIHDMADAPVDLSVRFRDSCNTLYSVRFKLRLDLDGNGSMETLIQSDSLAHYPPGFVPYNNAFNPALTEWRRFDFRPVADENRYRFALEATAGGDTLQYRLRWVSDAAPGVFFPLQLPYGQGKMEWVVEDTSGIEQDCKTLFTLRDCGKPVLSCLQGLKANIMPVKFITLWDTDFLQYAADNYTGASLQTAVRRSGDGIGFPLQPDGQPARSVTFSCADLGTQVVELWVRDAAGNSAWCETYTIIEDNGNYCDPNAPELLLCVSNCGKPFEDPVGFTLSGTHPGLPPGSIFGDPRPSPTMQGDCFGYQLGAIPFLNDYMITPTKDNDPLNGVTTFDLIRIAQHIEGLRPLDSPYKVIAADANNSRSVTTFDLVELRKLILGVYPELPNNTSWRFVNKKYQFPDPANPFTQIFPETDLLDPNTPDLKYQFEGVKTGDVTCNARTLITPPLSREDLPEGDSLCLQIPRLVLAAGESVQIPVSVASQATLLGYQFDLSYAPALQLTDLLPGPGQNTDNFAVFAQSRILATSWHSTSPLAYPAETALFYATFKALQAVRTDTAFALKSNRIWPEAYESGEAYQPLGLCFSGTIGTRDPAPAHAMRLQPNPATDRVWVHLATPGNMPVQWAILDLAGKTILQGVQEPSTAGQAFEIPLPGLAPGTYTCRLRCSAGVVSKLLVRG